MLESLGAQIKIALIHKNMSQGQLARALKITACHLSLIIHRKTNPSIPLLEKICRQLDFEILVLSKHDEQDTTISRLNAALKKLS
jgi:transcriptional regulator with XRE-family HTH domain